MIIYATGVDLFKNKKYLTDKNKRFADFCEKHGTVCNFEYKRASDLGKSISTYLAKSGCTITKSNAEYLANLCLCDTAFISKELEKLSAYAEGQGGNKRGYRLALYQAYRVGRIFSCNKYPQRQCGNGLHTFA